MQQMKTGLYVIIFLIINFGALALSSWLMDNGPQTGWYQNLNKAPWTPPGWVFGAAWTTIMLCFSIYMAILLKIHPHQKVVILFLIQLVLNVGWNYLFFNQHLVVLSLVCIALLTIIIFKFLFDFKTIMLAKQLLVLPYFIWLCIATSLNAYILIYN
ncbi:tryptophan-rich sensory protein [Tamlana crocina]|uniref:Tryptophan-rich sensory protein n=2 Tax=Tamlana crocina TaxID=393006 RepID=A0ABX1DAW2_9FLAO|nr:tryptophan-rich sensory protein [Tamlana crocina]